MSLNLISKVVECFKRLNAGHGIGDLHFREKKFMERKVISQLVWKVDKKKH